jgi:hypothetical protein
MIRPLLQTLRGRLPRNLVVTGALLVLSVTSFVLIATQVQPVLSESPRAGAAKASNGAVPSAREAVGTAAVAPLAEQPPAKLIVDPPQPDRLARGVVFIEYRTENLQMVPVFGPAALAVVPRLGHVHVTLDDAAWHWVDASGGPLIVAGLPPGPHSISIELANADHKPLAREVVRFEVPEGSHH